jgi:Pyridine nucleotide-disulphide oxidoreductase
MTDRHRVVIVGGGFGGLAAAKALRSAPVDVTLVDRQAHHLFQPLLYQVATGVLSQGNIAPPLAQHLPHGVHAPAHGSPAGVQHLLPVIHAAYLAAYAAALHPVFLTAAAVMLGGFGLSWRLRDVPLRDTAGSAEVEGGPPIRADRSGLPSGASAR